MTQRTVLVGTTRQISRPLRHVLTGPTRRWDGRRVITDIPIRGQRNIPARAHVLGHRFGLPILNTVLPDPLGVAHNADRVR